MNVLITGAGGPAAICVFKSLVKEDFNIHMADMDSLSAGLYLTGKDMRHIIPPAKADHYVATLLNLCKDQKIDILIPTVDFELIKIAEQRKSFENAGIRVVLTTEEVLKTIMNKYHLLDHLNKGMDVGLYDMLSLSSVEEWEGKKIVIKPTSGSGSRGVEFYNKYSDILQDKYDQDNIMIQEFIEGPEYSVDVMVSKNGDIKAVVPRLRMRTDSGVSVTGMVVDDQKVIEYAREIIQVLGLTYAANIQIIHSPIYGPRLIEINPRFSGGLSLVIESGANTPLMAVKEALDIKVEEVAEFKKIAMVRSFVETFMQANELMTS